MNKESRKSIITVILLLLSPLLSWSLTPITMIPAAIIGSFVTRGCKGSMCGFAEGIFITVFLNIIAAYIISLSIYLLTHKKEKPRKKIIVASLLLLYYAALVSGFILFARHEQGKLERKNLEVIESLQTLEAKDIVFVERTVRINKTDWKIYTKDNLAYQIKYPKNFRIQDHQAPTNYVFRAPDDSYPSAKWNRNNQFFTLGGFNKKFQQFPDDNEAINQAIKNINNANIKTPSFPTKINEPAEKSISTRGWKFYFIEKGSRKTTKEGLEFDELSIVINVPGRGYLFWGGHTTFEGGLELIKQVVEEVEEIR
ncbi:hypothetical protein ACFL0Y_00955 [Patescibacteria group bacterium]